MRVLGGVQQVGGWVGGLRVRVLRGVQHVVVVVVVVVL